MILQVNQVVIWKIIMKVNKFKMMKKMKVIKKNNNKNNYKSKLIKKTRNKKFKKF